MKKMNFPVFFILVLILVSVLNIDVKAKNAQFSYVDISEEEQRTVVENINLSLLLEEPEKNKITTFDVNNDGLIVIGVDNFNSKIVCVYTENGNFQYGYHFNSSGSFGVEWNGVNINIYDVRSDIAIEVDSNGNIKRVQKISTNAENNSYWNKVVFSTKKNINGVEYTLDNNAGFLNVFSSGYSQLVKTDGINEKIIYKSSFISFIRSGVIGLFTISFITVGVFYLKKEIRKIIDSQRQSIDSGLK